MADPYGRAMRARRANGAPKPAPGLCTMLLCRCPCRKCRAGRCHW